MIVVIAFFSWSYIARIVRGYTLSLREKEFVESARALGAGNRGSSARRSLPNLIGPLLVYSTLLIPTNILFEAALSFLGLGVPVTTSSWGSTLADAIGVLRRCLVADGVPRRFPDHHDPRLQPPRRRPARRIRRALRAMT